MAICNDLEIVPIAWNDTTLRFEPILCVDTDERVVFHDNYVCPAYRCPIYDVKEIIIPTLSDLVNSQRTLSPHEKIIQLVKKMQQKGINIPRWGFVTWCHTSSRKCENESIEKWQNILRKLAPLINGGYEIVELREEDESSSIIVAVPADQIPRLKDVIKEIYRGARKEQYMNQSLNN